MKNKVDIWKLKAGGVVCKKAKEQAELMNKLLQSLHRGKWINRKRRSLYKIGCK